MLRPGVTRAVLMVNGHRCQYCGKPATTADHIVPSHLGGRSNAGNLTAACRSCNSSKGAKRLLPEHEMRLKTRAAVMAGLVATMTSVYQTASTRTLREARARTRATAKD